MKKIIKFYPFLIAFYPILALRNFNISYVSINSLFRSIVLALVATAILLTGLSLILKNGAKARLITSLALILFFTYGHVYLAVEDHFGQAISHRYLILLTILIFALVTGLILWKYKNQPIVENFLAVFGAALFIISLVQSAAYDIPEALASQKAEKTKQSTVVTNSNLPDIYYIILDSYTRSDILQKDFDYDNSGFIQQLESMGFYVAKCSQSNFPITRFSLTSSMYMDYLQNFVNDSDVFPTLQLSPVNQTLKSLGYTTIAFENHVNDHFNLREDIHLARNKNGLNWENLTQGPNEFESELIDTTALRIFLDMPQLLPWLKLSNAVYAEHYKQSKYILSELPKVPEMNGTKFVFVHLLVPHDPYIFDQNGNYKVTGNSVAGYRGNVDFLDHQIPGILEQIIQKSKTPPIIIVQGDHGAALKRESRSMRMAILNAYYVKPEARAKLYDSITPVNSFRIILDTYFGQNYPLLADESYYAYKKDQFTTEYLVPNTCK